MSSPLVGLLALSLGARAFDGNDQIKVVLATGEVIEGWFYRLEPDGFRLSGDNRFTAVPVALVATVEVNGAPLTRQELELELAEMRQRMDLMRQDPPPMPHPVAVASLSMVWAGGGQAALGEWKSFAGYSVVETVLLGTVAYNVQQRSNPQVIASVAVLDLFFRAYSAGEAVRETKKRRARVASSAE